MIRIGEVMEINCPKCGGKRQCEVIEKISKVDSTVQSPLTHEYKCLACKLEFDGNVAQEIKCNTCKHIFCRELDIRIKDTQNPECSNKSYKYYAIENVFSDPVANEVNCGKCQQIFCNKMNARIQNVSDPSCSPFSYEEILNEAKT
jgi:DNA-directed RNA polymerase subunit RPC12/RpoP